ncbi:hypothetical protein PYW08_002090 [Mythimna loreyi]|uniref:Uncharacterized protein n=1 Tax=Mythimna loreyi TaxID=667449 RepID=A0ACC2R0T1_9NEOP|nr:hypothetical protein PYW08_002090 [Mythimna loreyi]
MKWLFYVIVLVWMFYRTVYALKPVKQSIVENTLSVDEVSYGEDDFLKVGGHITISCKPSNKNQKVEWVDPNGNVVKRIPSSRIFSQNHFVSAMRGRPPALVLTVTRATVEDSGVYECRSEDLSQNVTLCVIDPSDFTDTPAEVVVSDVGRSITLSCQAKGNPEPRISWIRNGETISDDDSSGKYRVMTKYNIQGFEGLLTITSLEPEDSGVYTCLNIQENLAAENCSHTSTFNITLNVNFRPDEELPEPSLHIMAKSTVYDVGDSKVIFCSGQNLVEPIHWYSPLGKLIEERSTKNSRVFVDRKIEDNYGILVPLIIHKVKISDGGDWTCKAGNLSETVEIMVNHAPIFAGGNKTEFVYGNTDELVDIECSADGYPAPTYRFFKEMSDDVMFEFDENQIKLVDDGAKAVMTVVANKSTYWKTFKCEATNEHGSAEKYFSILKAERPKKPDEISLYNSTSESVFLNVIWTNDIQFPITDFVVQYISDGGKSLDVNKPATWRRSKQVEIPSEAVLGIDPDINGVVIELEELEPETNYWIRLRVTNEIGDSLWSDPLKVSTGVKEEEETTTEDPEAEPEVAGDETTMTETTFYGIFFFGGIFVVSFVCMFAMKMVK